MAVALFAVSVALSRGKQMAPWEAFVFYLIHDLPKVFFPFFIAVTQLGSIYTLGVLVLLFVLKSKYHIVLRLLLSGTLAYMLSGVAKDLWGRGRPFELLADATNLEFIVRGPGFPSGHMALAVALAMVIGHYLPRKFLWVPIVWIISVALSRIYLGVHAPLDMVGGFAIGWFSYALFRRVRLYDTKHHYKKKAIKPGAAAKK